MRREEQLSVPIDPFRAWLRARVAEYGRDHVAASMGVSRVNLEQYISPSKRVRVHIDTVDRMLCAVGEPWLLRELYPDLYESKWVLA